MTPEWDVVVVGAGTSGAPLAARLADAGRRVLVLEAGADHLEFPADLRDAARMAAAVMSSARESAQREWVFMMPPETLMNFPISATKRIPLIPRFTA